MEESQDDKSENFSLQFNKTLISGFRAAKDKIEEESSDESGEESMEESQNESQFESQEESLEESNTK